MRFRIEIYDEVKANDLTIYSDQGMDIEALREVVFSNLRRFNGTVKAFVFDNKVKKKTAAVMFNMDTVNKVKTLVGA